MAPGPTFPSRGRTPLSECSPVLPESVFSSKGLSHVLVGNTLVFPLEGFQGVMQYAALSHKAGLRTIVVVPTAHLWLVLAAGAAVTWESLSSLSACFSFPLHLSVAQNQAGVPLGQQRVGVPKVWALGKTLP